MAWENITYKCGHEDAVQLYGTRKNREQRKYYLEQCDCPACQAKENSERAAALNLPDLTGSEKQIRWAEDIRLDILEDIDTAIESILRYKEDEEVISAVHKAAEELKEVTSAHWWIENRSEGPIGMIIMLAEKIYKENQEIKSVTPAEVDAQTEATVVPEETDNDTVVEIVTTTKEKVIAKCEYNKDAINIFKEFGMAWNKGEKVWEKADETVGETENFVAALGNALLNAGFPIRIYDPVIREKAINGDFKPPQKNWILVKDAKIIIKFKGDDVYQAARRISGAKYNKGGFIIPESSADELMEFAEMHGFTITEAAKNKLLHYKDGLRIVQPAAPPEEEKTNNDYLQQILESDRDVLDDLKEDE